MTDNNILVYTEDFVKGKLINEHGDITHPRVKLLTLSDENVTKLKNLLEDGISTTLAHRCLSVYRDAIIIQENVYNICLSCGDYFENENHFYLTNEEEIKEFLDALKNQ